MALSLLSHAAQPVDGPVPTGRDREAKVTDGRSDSTVAHRPGNRAFSLIELVIVVVIMGIVAAMAVSRFGEFALRARIATTREAVRALQATIDGEQAATGQWPGVITSVMFVGDRWPRNAFLPGQKWLIDTVDNANQNPGDMSTTDLDAGSFWYNTRLGIVRARVMPMGSNAETLALYNLVNGTTVGALSTAPSGGAVGKLGGQLVEVTLD